MPRPPRTALPVFDRISAPLQVRVVELLLKLSSGMRRFAWDRAAAAGLTPTQGEILRHLQRAPRGMRMREVADALGVSAPTTSDAVNALESKGLVVRHAEPDDRRVLRLTPTAAGAALAGELDSWFDDVAAAVATLSPDSEASLFTTLLQVLVTLQTTGGMPTSKMCVTCRHFSPNVTPDTDYPHRCELVGAPFGDRHLRVDCPEHELAATADATQAWRQGATRSKKPAPAAVRGTAKSGPRRTRR